MEVSRSTALWSAAAVVGLSLTLSVWRALRSPREAAASLVVVVTGGSKGIGRALVVRHLQRGDRVVAASRSIRRADLVQFVLGATDLAESAVEERLVVVPCDVTEDGQVGQLLETAVGRYGRVDLFVANAGVLQRPLAPLVELELEEALRVLRTNAEGSVVCARRAFRAMMEQKENESGWRGHVVLMGGAGTRGFASSNFACYGYTKAGMPQLVKSLSKEMKEHRVGVHVMTPGMVTTDMLLEGHRPRARRFINILADTPSKVSAWAVPRLRALNSTGTNFHYNSVVAMLLQLATSPLWSKNRLIEEETGERLYAETWSNSF